MKNRPLGTAQATKGLAEEAKTPLTSRRGFLQRLAVGVCSTANLSRVGATVEPATGGPERSAQFTKTESDVGSLFQFIQSQAVKADFSLSFLNPRFKSYKAWKRQARSKLLALLHYAPAPCDPQPETAQRLDKGHHIQEKIYFNTTRDIRLPAYLLIPKSAKFPAPAIVALHDHGGFYFWGKEKLVETENEHPVLTDFKREWLRQWL